MENEAVQPLDLHDKMLNFVYKKQALASSCYAYIWEDFKVQHEIDLTAGL